MNKLQTPLEKLNSDKQKFRKLCTTQEQELNDDFTYLHEHVGSLLLSGFSSLLFPNSRSKTKTTDTNAKTPAKTTGQPVAHLGVSDYFTIALGAVPLVWDFARPFVMTWGIRKAQEWFFKKLFKRKK